VFYTQPAPQPQPQQVYYVQQPVAQPAAKPVKQVSKGKKVASIILGIHSLLFALAALGTFWIPVFGLIYSLCFGFAGLIFGIIGTALCKRGVAIAGIIISAIAIVLGIIMAIIYGVSGLLSNSDGIINSIISQFE
jgi:hypothetical protein